MKTSQDRLFWQTMNDKLEKALSSLLIQGDKQFTEHQLIQILIEKPFQLFEEKALRNNLGLFQTHFIIFHVLYKLRARWIDERRCWLEISPLAIGTKPSKKFEAANHIAITAGSQTELQVASKLRVQTGNSGEAKTSQLIEADPLTEYYLDLGNLWQASEHSVNNLLNLFWQDFLNPAQKLAAFELLGCSARDNPEAIKKAYRKLAMKHHPDRGGNGDSFKKLQEAYSIVRLYQPVD